MAGPLQREVEAPRTVTRWGPLLVLTSGAMIAIMSTAVMTSRPRVTVRPVEIDHRSPAVDRGRVTPAPAELCAQRVWRAHPDGRAEQFEDCAALVRK